MHSVFAGWCILYIHKKMSILYNFEDKRGCCTVEWTKTDQCLKMFIFYLTFNIFFSISLMKFLPAFFKQILLSISEYFCWIIILFSQSGLGGNPHWLAAITRCCALHSPLFYSGTFVPQHFLHFVYTIHCYLFIAENWSCTGLYCDISDEILMQILWF